MKDYLIHTTRFAIIVLISVQTYAQMQIRSYDPARHDRFYVGIDKDFIGANYDWSGVGKKIDSDKHWATLISPSYFLSANHFHPALGDTFRFYATNDPTKYYEDRTVIFGQRIGNSDLFLGKFDRPLTNKITTYPILKLRNYASYIQQEIYIMGRSDRIDPSINMRMGKNKIKSVRHFSEKQIQWKIDERGNYQADEVVLTGGDSGGPSFVIVNNRPILTGVHNYVNSDTLIKAYIDEIRSIIIGETVRIARPLKHHINSRKTEQTITTVRLDSGGRRIQVSDTFGQLFNRDYELTCSIRIRGSYNDDLVVLDFENGNPIPSGGIYFDGKRHSKIGDKLTIDNANFINGKYKNNVITTGAIAFDDGLETIEITYKDVEYIQENCNTRNRIFGSNTSVDQDLYLMPRVTNLTRELKLRNAMDFLPNRHRNQPTIFLINDAKIIHNISVNSLNPEYNVKLHLDSSVNKIIDINSGHSVTLGTSFADLPISPTDFALRLVN